MDFILYIHLQLASHAIAAVFHVIPYKNAHVQTYPLRSGLRTVTKAVLVNKDFSIVESPQRYVQNAF